MPGGKTYKLEQVSVRLKLMEEAPLYSTEKIDTPDKAIKIMCDMMKTLDREHICVVNLDGASHPINFNVVSVGSINSSPIAMRELFKTAILSNASNIIMLHNHPSSNINPSREDHAATARVMMAALTMGIPLVDHIIVGGGTGEYFSYRKELKGMFNISGIQTFLKANGMESVFAEQVIEYRPRDLGPKRVVEEKDETDGTVNAKDVVAEYRKETESHFNEIAGMEAGDIEAFVIAEAQKTLDDMDLHVEIVDAVLIGNNAGDNERDGKNLYVALEYKPLAKVEELEEENYNQIDNYLSNSKPKAEEIREKRQEDTDRIRPMSKKDRPSLLARMREKKAIVDARKAEQGATERRPKVDRIV